MKRTDTIAVPAIPWCPACKLVACVCHDDGDSECLACGGSSCPCPACAVRRDAWRGLTTGCRACGWPYLCDGA